MWFLEKYKHFRLYVRNTHIGARQKAEKSLWDHVEKAHEGPTDRLIVTWQMIDFFGLRYVLFFFFKKEKLLLFLCFKYLFFWQCWVSAAALGPSVLVVACRPFSCGMWIFLAAARELLVVVRGI